MEHEFGRRVWTAALTGVPFGIYKMGFGWHQYDHGHSAIGIAVIAWGAIDIGLNLVVVLWPRVVAWCLLASIGRTIDEAAQTSVWEAILLALDTTASFAIVSVMILFGRLPLEPPLAAVIWNLAVVCNVLSVGLEQLCRAVTTRSATE